MHSSENKWMCSHRQAIFLPLLVGEDLWLKCLVCPNHTSPSNTGLQMAVHCEPKSINASVLKKTSKLSLPLHRLQNRHQGLQCQLQKVPTTLWMTQTSSQNSVSLSNNVIVCFKLHTCTWAMLKINQTPAIDVIWRMQRLLGSRPSDGLQVPFNTTLQRSWLLDV